MLENEAINTRIKKLRKEKGLTQNELGNILGLTDRAISKWESGDGNPDISLLPKIAKLFNVTTDYLLTGNIEKNITFEDPIEYVLKNNDVNLMIKEKIIINLEDILNSSYYPYSIFKHLITNEFEKYCNYIEELLLYKFYIQKDKRLIYIEKIINLVIYSKTADLFFKVKTKLAYNDNKPYFYKSKNSIGNLLFRDLSFIKDNDLYWIMNNYEDLFNSLINPLQNKLEASIGHGYYPLVSDSEHVSPSNNVSDYLLAFLKCAVQNKNMHLTDKLFNLIGSFNAKQILNATNSCGNINDTNNKFPIKYLDNYVKAETHWKYYWFPLCPITLDCQKLILKYCYKKIDIALKINNKINYDKNVSNYEIKLARLNNDKSISNDDLIKESCLHDEIICIDDLIATNDYKLIKEMFNQYPIHEIEYLINLAKQKNIKKLFEYSVDNKLETLTNYISEINDRINTDDKYIFSYNVDKEIIDKLWLNNKNQINIKYLNQYNFNQTYPALLSIYEFIKECKPKILDEINLQFQLNKNIANLTKEYFEKELSKKNYDMIIIKLCVRLESILKYSYKYQGDFSEMMDTYCKEHNQNNNVAINLFNKLRKCRNNIVHSDIEQENMSVDEIKKCIDIICKMK